MNMEKFEILLGWSLVILAASFLIVVINGALLTWLWIVLEKWCGCG